MENGTPIAEETAVQRKVGIRSKASNKQRYECFMAALPELNPNWNKEKPRPKKYDPNERN